MRDRSIEVVATTISGSIKDWGKIKRIVPLFHELGWEDVKLHVVKSHQQARDKTTDLVKKGCRVIISAGGSGTFNSVLEGCLGSGIPITEITLGFLRKGSADLIGKALGMPDEIEQAVGVFADSLTASRTVKCDIIQTMGGGIEGPRHFVGYGGAEIFGMIPSITENRFIKYYKGILSQLLGDLGPFFVAAFLCAIRNSASRLVHKGQNWKIYVDGELTAMHRYQAMIIVNGYLGPELPFAKSVPLGSGDFYMFGIRDLGLSRLPFQFRHAWDSSILEQPEKWGFESYRINQTLRIEPERDTPFPLNLDGSTLLCNKWAEFRIVDQINLISSD